MRGGLGVGGGSGPTEEALAGIRGPDGTTADLPRAAEHRTDNIFAARRLACAGLGFAVLPRWLVADDLATGALVALCPDWQPPPAQLSLAYRPARYRPARLTALIRHLCDEAKAGQLTHPAL